MPRVLSPATRMSLMRCLSAAYDGLCERHRAELEAIGNRVPVGGEGWMDLFFKMEGVRGVLTALRNGKTLTYAVQFGKDASAIAVQIWNKHREYQVHRWEQTAWDFIDREVRRGMRDV